MDHQPNNPLHGVKLEQIINKLVEHYGWQALGNEIAINCFRSDPSVKSSLKFLRKTPWAREKVEQLYVDTFAGNATTEKADPWAAALKKLDSDA
ncbi:VF530 family protein [Grimontia sp. SpTr1]|uniref:VF530 family protein n=1 Tax=Grimontia sp. SpTr1 TaxID=2995319 RepID=UPI00248C7BC3|nr:VF530 family protein [Grimontia sp. SpTr1]